MWICAKATSEIQLPKMLNGWNLEWTYPTSISKAGVANSWLSMIECGSRSAEWDLMSLTSERHEEIYPGCCGPEKYVDITYYFRLKRKVRARLALLKSF